MPRNLNGSVTTETLSRVFPSDDAKAIALDDNSDERFGHYAYRIIQKNFKKVVKYEQAVLDDSDPEALHQMRVGLRRLRSALQACGGAVNLPKAAGDRAMKKLAQRLGDLRDMDVLIAKLRDQYRPNLKGKARRAIDTVLKQLRKERKTRVAAVKSMLTGNRYYRFKEAYQTWLNQPQYGAIAAYPAQDILPDVLAPSLSEVFLHPGWLFCVIPDQSPLVPSRLSSGALHQALSDQGDVLHSLRKSMKRVRYQAEFFDEVCPALQGYIQDFKAIQDVLGQIQDCAVLRSTLRTYGKKDWANRWPAIALLIQHDEETAWQDWQPYQAQYLCQSFRTQLRSAILGSGFAMPQT